MAEKILIICRNPDPHVEAVLNHIKEYEIPYEIWDLNSTNSFPFALSSSNKNFSKTQYRAIWWRYKSTVKEYQGITSPTESFIIREWLAALKAFSALTTSTLWVNNPVSTSECNLKIRNLQVARNCGFKIPETLVTNCTDTFNNFIHSFENKEIIYKPLTYYYEAPDIATFTSLIPKDSADKFQEYIHVAPVLLQEMIEKKYELRITVIDNEVFPIRIESQSYSSTLIDWRRDQFLEGIYSTYILPEDIKNRILKLHKELKLVYGAYDFIVNHENQYIFLEVNPCGQWLWLEHATGIKISGALAKLLINGQVE